MKRKQLAAFAAVAGMATRQTIRTRIRDTVRAEGDAIRAAAVAAAELGPPPDGELLAVVIAAYNESASISSVLRSLPDSVCGLPTRAIVVDDGSNDGTAAVAADLGAITARHSRNLGQGDGLRTGIALALTLGASIVVTMDADGQHDPNELPHLVKPILTDEADYVQGSRFYGRYDDAGGARHAGIKGFTALINVLAGIEISDCTNGYRAIRASRLARMHLAENRFSAAEIVMEAAAQGLRILEVPVHIRSREVGESRKPRGLGYPIRFFGTIMRVWVRTRLRRVSAPAGAK